MTSGTKRPSGAAGTHPGALAARRASRPLDPAGQVDLSHLAGARWAGPLPGFVPPELATLVKEAPEGDAWLHEIKFDGIRTLAGVEDGSVRMYSRNGKDWTDRFPELAGELAVLPVKNALLDGEVVMQLSDGTTSFEKLVEALGPATSPGGRPESGRKGHSDGRLLYYVFDLLCLDGFDLLGVPLEKRRELLRRILARAGEEGRLRFSESLRGDGRTVLEEACRSGLEGVVSKRMATPYRPGVRGTDWVKSKCRRRQEFVIGGFTDPSGARTGFGALLLGVYTPRGLQYIGKVGTGFDEERLASLSRRLREIETVDPPFVAKVPAAAARRKSVHWVRPELVAEVEFMEWTAGGSLRHPSFAGLREDKSPQEVVAEIPAEGQIR
ncbi:MAG: non-homologous end-joining DNA ligase [Actinomycetia bacterium]|nr:non-homologous end-joining DNA ligase [Actinomycetes bacterium]